MGSIVWLASYPKSGNTWVRYFLHVLPEAHAAPLNRLNASSTGDASADWYRPLLRRPLEESTYEEIAKVRPHAIRHMAASKPGLVFIKTHNALVAHAGSPMIDTAVTSGAIYIVRNPLDVAISLAGFLAKTLDEAIDEITRTGAVMPSSDRFAYQYFGSWSEHVESWTRRPMRQLYVMRYEDMLDRPRETFGALARFLLLKATPDEIDAAIAASSFDKLRKEEEELGFTGRFGRAILSRGQSGTVENASERRAGRPHRGCIRAPNAALRLFAVGPPKDGGTCVDPGKPGPYSPAALWQSP